MEGERATGESGVGEVGGVGSSPGGGEWGEFGSYQLFFGPMGPFTNDVIFEIFRFMHFSRKNTHFQGNGSYMKKDSP